MVDYNIKFPLNSRGLTNLGIMLCLIDDFQQNKSENCVHIKVSVNVNPL